VYNNIILKENNLGLFSLFIYIKIYPKR